MLKIRLKRVGRRNHPSFRVVVTESSKGPKSGKVIDTLGFYEPMAGKKEIDSEKAGRWVSNGAQPSDTVHNMLVDIGVVKGKKINALPKKSPIIKEKEEEEKPAEAKAAAPAEEGAEQEEEVVAGEEEEAEAVVAESADSSAEPASESESPAEEPKQEEETTETPEEGSEEEKSE
jgi:small subunit ribosomal protein S16